MANAIYPKWKEAIIQASANSSLGGTLKVALVDTGTYTYSSAHEFYSSVSGVVGTPQTISTKTYTNGTLDGDNVTFTAVTGSSVEALVIYIDTGIDAMNMMANLNRVIPVFQDIAALPNIGPYVQDQFGDANYNVATEFSAMVNALVSLRNWLQTNIPANAVSIVNGQLTGNTYTPAQTATLRSLVAAAQATID